MLPKGKTYKEFNINFATLRSPSFLSILSSSNSIPSFSSYWRMYLFLSSSVCTQLGHPSACCFSLRKVLTYLVKSPKR